MAYEVKKPKSQQYESGSAPRNPYEGLTMAAAPSSNVGAARTPGGIEVEVTGFAPARRVTNVEFSFDVRNGTGTERVVLTRNVETDFANWYRNSASTAFGGSFSFVQSFTVTGDTSAIESVTIRLTNAQGSTVSGPVRLQ